MKLPYVSRVTFEAAIDHATALQREANDMRGQRDRAADLCAKSTETIGKLRGERDRAHADGAALKLESALLRDAVIRERKRCDDLLEKYHALRSQGFAPIDAHAFPLVESPLSTLGPKTQAALTSEGRKSGVSRMVRAAMENAALTMFAQGLEDDVIAHAVVKGETLRRVG